MEAKVKKIKSACGPDDLDLQQLTGQSIWIDHKGCGFKSHMKLGLFFWVDVISTFNISYLMDKKDVIILLPYIHVGLHSNHITKHLKSCVNRFYAFVNVNVIFQITWCIKSFFPYKDCLDRSQSSSHLQSQLLGLQQFLYWGNKVKILEWKMKHLKALLKLDHSSVIADHIRITGHNFKWDNFDILIWLLARLKLRSLDYSRVTASIECQCKQ